MTTELVLEGYSKPLSIDPGSWEVLAHHDPALAAELAPYLERQRQMPAQRIGPVVRRTRLASSGATSRRGRRGWSRSARGRGCGWWWARRS